VRGKFATQTLVACILVTAAVSVGLSGARSAAVIWQVSTLHPPQSSASLVPIGGSGPVLGVNLYALHNYTAAQTTADGERTLFYIKNRLRADAVDLVWIMYVPGGHTSNSVVTNNTTLTAANIGILTRLAKKYGLAVEYRPMLFIQTKGNTWEGLIKPTNPAKWFNSYYEKNLPYLKMAQRYHISEYIIGTEMNRLSPDSHWPSFLARAAKAFEGQISYTANDHLYFPPYTQMPTTRLTGVDMYEPLKLSASAPLNAVVAAYEKYFSTVPKALLKRTAIQETGIEARAGAYADPPNLRLPGTLDEVIQYNWFIAGCRAVKRFQMRGVFFWKVDLSDFPITRPASSLSTFEGKLGATAIAQCATILHGTKPLPSFTETPSSGSSS
jgi:hypothetical protein